ncbi:MAG: glutamyl-tRNA reductase [Chloroflexi bacterium RBG_13_60_13]|nr:MAG: glutamyl-tRNA reductase [Chloroflexi bacterium RBG_13_60_13]
MDIILVGLNYKTAPLYLRERFALGTEELPEALAYLQRETGNGVILSTCNRTELYFRAERNQYQRADALRLLAGATGANTQPLARHIYILRNEKAIRHLHRVAAGLDSMILGESEILGQIRAALSIAAEAQLCNAILSRLFHSAIRAGRRVHSESLVCHHGRSVSSAAVALARRLVGDLSQRSVLVIGAGEAGALTARSLVKARTHHLLITNRTGRRAADLAKQLGAAAVPFARLSEVLADADVVISASGADRLLVSKEQVAAAMAQRNGHTLLLIDIAVPRDIDVAVRGMKGVELYDIDDLATMCPITPEEQGKEKAKAEAIVEEEVQRCLAWWHSLRAVPTIVSLRRNLEDIRKRETAKTLRRLRHLEAREREGIDALTRAIVKKMLHCPVTRLKAHSSSQDYLAATRDLFGLDGEEAVEQAAEPVP